MISGEWAVLYDEPCIAVPVDVGISVDIEKRDDQKIEVRSDIFSEVVVYDVGEDGEIVSTVDDISHRFVYFALQKSLKYVSELGISISGFSLDLFTSNNRGEKTEIESGFGSSAATVASTVKAVFSIFDLPMNSFEDLLVVYKIAYLAHFEAQGKKGSGYDVAVSVFEKPLFYKRPFEDFVNEERENMLDFALMDWDGLEIIEFNLPESVAIYSKHVGIKASTEELVSEVDDRKNVNEEEFFKIFDEIGKVSKRLLSASEQNQCERFVKLIARNNMLLKELSDLVGGVLFIEEYSSFEKEIEKLGGAFKFSGAGGGDSIIAVFCGEADGLTGYRKIS